MLGTTLAVPSPALPGPGGGAPHWLSPTRRTGRRRPLQSESGRGRGLGRAHRARGHSARAGIRGGRWGRGQRRRGRARGGPGCGRRGGWPGLQAGRAPDGRGSPLSGRSSCASPGGRPIGAAEAKDRTTDTPPAPAQTGIMTVPKEMPEKWARAGAPPSWSRKKPSWGTGNGRQRLAALPRASFPPPTRTLLVLSLPQPSPILSFPNPEILAVRGPVPTAPFAWSLVTAQGLDPRVPSGEVSGSKVTAQGRSSLGRQKMLWFEVLLLQCALRGSWEG